ncbi:hypothetical protein [Staphylococcus gallinarum]|uniref:hypothetical protein n=1 Tax=Staphylococcus gallinarum TaxID=1293 RepID=UPI001E5FDCEE|nr:hypothetical protein [Staphylococcus gallinarum]MCD8828923.1 hypothetical protein [Staphylococcus gallinarum]MCD8902856.1 hypothetical protein [Staphylococcus gallinarum]MEB6055672.1 hypothetical protein [Staphylococcus gallinarum]MEB6237205.1 hypothetical protein [Staphylococcus gallinarum]
MRISQFKPRTWFMISRWILFLIFTLLLFFADWFKPQYSIGFLLIIFILDIVMWLFFPKTKQTNTNQNGQE